MYISKPTLEVPLLLYVQVLWWEYGSPMGCNNGRRKKMKSRLKKTHSVWLTSLRSCTNWSEIILMI